MLTITVLSVDRIPLVRYPPIVFVDHDERLIKGQLDFLGDHLIDADSRQAVLVAEGRTRVGRVGWRRPALEALANWLDGQTADLVGPLLELRDTSMQALNR